MLQVTIYIVGYLAIKRDALYIYRKYFLTPVGMSTTFLGSLGDMEIRMIGARGAWSNSERRVE